MESMEEDQALLNDFDLDLDLDELDLDLSWLADFDPSSTTPLPATTFSNNSPTTEDSPSFSHAMSLCPPPTEEPCLSFPYHPPVILSHPEDQQSGSSSLTTTTTLPRKNHRFRKKNVMIIHDKRSMEMIRSRGYALRARARKKARNKDLELQLDQLQKENERLELRIERLKLSVEKEFPEKRTSLYRACTAPF